MKIVLTTTTLVAVLAIGLLGLNNSSSGNNIGNAFAQMESGDSSMMGNEAGMMGNDTMSMGNDTSMMMNATLAYAQDDTAGMMGMEDEGMMMTMSNQSKEIEMTKLNGTIEVERTIAEAFKPKITIDIIGAIQAAQTSVGANSFVKEAELTDAHGYLVYKMKVVDENMKKHKVIVDPGNGQVILKKEVTWYDEHEKMKYGDEEKYDKYGGHGDEYDKKKMMMKDKEY